MRRYRRIPYCTSASVHGSCKRQRIAIPYFFHGPPAGRGREGGHPAIAGVKDAGNVRRFQFAPPDGDEQPHDVADHLLEKAVRLEAPCEFKAAVGDAALRGAGDGQDGTHRRAEIRPGVFQAGKVPFAKEVPAPLVHTPHIHRAAGPDEREELRRRVTLGKPEAVFVGLADGAVLRVEGIRHKDGIRDAYVARQERIEGQLPVHAGARFGNVEMGDLRFGVNARVSPSGAVHVDTLAEHMGHGILNDVLNGGQGGGVFEGLRLPPVVLGAYVGYRQLEAGHGRPLGKTKTTRVLTPDPQQRRG